MDSAIQIEFGQTEEVTAAAVKQRFHGRVPSNIRFLCPLCRRPVNPCSMGERNVYSPYFKHQQDDPVAKKCDLFTQTYGYGNPYKRVPLPMHIRPSKDHPNRYVIEIGLRPIGREHIETFERNNSRLLVEEKVYNITRDRFCGSTFKAALDKPTMKPSNQVRVENLPREYEKYWGSIEDPMRAMIFSCDPISEQGRRLNAGDSLGVGIPFYLVSTEQECSRAKNSLADAKRVGTAGLRSGSLVVMKAVVPREKRERQRAEEYLMSCGFAVSEFDPTPIAVWPPALQGTGDIIPLFKKAPSVFISPMPSNQALSSDYLYQYSDENRLGDPRRFPLIRIKGTDFGLCAMRRARLFCYVGSRSGAFSTAALLRDTDLERLSTVSTTDIPLDLEVNEIDEIKEVVIRPSAPIAVTKMQIGKPRTKCAPGDDSAFLLCLRHSEAALIETAPPGYPTQRPLLWIANKCVIVFDETARTDPRSAVLRGTGASIAFARLGYSTDDGKSNRTDSVNPVALLRARRKE